MNNIYGLSNIEIENWKKKSDQIIIPIGSLEQHGPHLPVSTDTIIIEYLAKKIAEKIQSLYIPAITFGISFEHEPLFNISLSNNTFSNLIGDICVSLAKYGMNNIILLNGHHGNMGSMYYISQNISHKVPSNIHLNFINYWNLMNDFDHAGEIETSLLLAINTKMVKMKMARANTKEIGGSKVAYSSLTSIPGSFPKITGNGVWGDPTKASIKKGRSLLVGLMQKLEQTLIEFREFSS
ncbi:MAG TPA: creatininase family protein [Nitrososphaeraceae archaeon]|nr:creatininase family protein [Nitrososphaeraceae archaeon]